LAGVSESASNDGRDWLLRSELPAELLPRVAPYALERKLALVGLALERESLEQRFLALALGGATADAA
jgi:hypothetical protein